MYLKIDLYHRTRVTGNYNVRFYYSSAEQRSSLAVAGAQIASVSFCLLSEVESPAMGSLFLTLSKEI